MTVFYTFFTVDENPINFFSSDTSQFPTIDSVTIHSFEEERKTRHDMIGKKRISSIVFF